MKKIMIIFAAVLILGCETTSTVVTGSWKSPRPSKPYQSIVVAALTSHAVAKSTIEDELAAALKSNGISAKKSIDEFPPNMTVSDSGKEMLMSKLKTTGADAILTVSLLKKETDSRYVPGTNPYDPYGNFGYYRRFWGYYSYWYPSVNEAGYYTTDRTYYMETNLYDAATEELVWSAQSETYNPIDLPNFAGEYANVIIAKMQKDGVLLSNTSSNR